MAPAASAREGSVERSGDVALDVQRPQAADALPVTVRDVGTMGTWARGRRLRGSAARTAVAGAIERVGLTDLASRPLTALSGGQRQRALVAQGIARRPELLLLDEPAAGLDSDSRARTLAILTQEASRGAAVVCVTHDDEAIAVADRIVRVERGRVVSASR